MSENLQLFATCAKGLEALLFDELNEIGAADVRQTLAGCWFRGDLALAYRTCLWSRLASRVLLKLGECEALRADAVPAAVAETQWETVFNPSRTFIIDFRGQNQDIRHTQFGAQLVKDGIVDHFRAIGESRPTVSKDQPDIRINAHLNKDKLTWYLDLSGDSLHRRGYRQEQGAAPLRETLAAGVVLRAGVTRDTGIILDPFCGSGTLLLEAAMICFDRAPGLTRRGWGFEAWLNHDEKLWQRELQEAEERHQRALESSNARFFGSDTDPKMLAIAEQNATRLGLAGKCDWQMKAADKVTSPVVASEETVTPLLVCNPPYGERLGEEVETLLLYRRFGQQLRQQFQGWQAAVLAGDEQLLKRMKLRSTKKYKLFNGALETVLALYDLTKEQPEFTQSQSNDLANRLRKNYQKLEKWASKEGVSAWRLYDADMPEYNAAVDVYNDYLVIQEYAAPKDIPEAVAKERLWFLLDTLAQELPFNAEKMTLKVRQRQIGKQQYQKQQPRGLTTVVNEYDAQFMVNLSDYLDTGLFLDHRWARQELARLSAGKTVLNLFAYTCTASVHAALAGAKQVVSVDLSKTYLNWGEDNFRLNKIDTRQHQFVQADCLTWLREQRPQQRFDVIFLDPPTFSNSKRMDDVLDVQRDHPLLLKLAARLLKDNGVILFSNNKRRFKLDEEALAELYLKAEDLTQRSIPLDFSRNKNIHHLYRVTSID
ncbi:bifunctional 23S rRNA (guanine(2069)-N(7))-methyltransferase RlmK/23S rRNA (guanine(2445)-N(2))-methyltransferase RlmL [Pseudidiomarina sp.]|uniref:bifunctional 23S rRNA (guanine(2069)-N(7))-methyltransferase RlmK/23S rRNA (guanine(2445)-N(2))-methyltransferase RlmL n=1 Tax=Pseudidiomarina sp. TaxID=2081707 RepID=UPI00299E16DD|nr:bifunctional 23S rRNA (guanine(2069)-N(7))-methyltransferase RlmK/23S rRNA (guanine(2445)-N(2))-methyltransferase RlmL [Pseudidiomarina sp.]MDX1705013.1 bifunctional 23S rRNA (guanine(2069)-N(7))-methyltransferase RlmK/23S rRNA (guanine(2445)-N(2))-methyltransferase RlmL [Pseudidiomarina sp.]